MEKLVATLERRRSGARVIKLSGVLDKDHRLEELAHEAASGLAIINLAGVERVEDNATHDWLNWLGTLTPNDARPVLTACSPAVVEVLNRIENLASKLVVKSFNIPYHCDACHRDQLFLAHVAQLRSSPSKAPECACDECGAPMTFQGDAKSYFAFLPSVVRAARASEAPPSSTPSEPPAEIARGSRTELGPEQLKRISQPQLLARSSRQSLSMFQMIDNVRGSAPQIDSTDNAPASRMGHWLLIGTFAVLIGTLAVLAYFVAA